jgi:O2-independent ubiquinone biosynthesis protein UbiV
VNATAALRVSLGPVPYHWPRDELLAFYRRVENSAVHIVYLGETVCSKRRELSAEDWLAVAERLAGTGKEVVLSTLALIEAESELAALARYCANDRFLVEANDVAAVNLLAARKQPFVCGPTINIYNARTLRLLCGDGMRRWVPPVELDRDTLRTILAESAGQSLETEVLAHGPLPLAWSARCFTARARDLPKDHCAFTCLNDAQGLPLATQEGQPLFTLNGIQVQSGLPCDLTPHWQEMAAMGVDILRVSPSGLHSVDVADALVHDLAQNRVPQPAADACNGYWLGTAGMTRAQSGAA